MVDLVRIIALVQENKGIGWEATLVEELVCKTGHGNPQTISSQFVDVNTSGCQIFRVFNSVKIFHGGNFSNYGSPFLT